MHQLGGQRPQREGLLGSAARSSHVVALQGLLQVASMRPAGHGRMVETMLAVHTLPMAAATPRRVALAQREAAQALVETLLAAHLPTAAALQSEVTVAPKRRVAPQ
jgi:hypothetical protein